MHSHPGMASILFDRNLKNKEEIIRKLIKNKIEVDQQ